MADTKEKLIQAKEWEEFYKKWVGKLPSCQGEAIAECSKCYKRKERFSVFLKDIAQLQQETEKAMKEKLESQGFYEVIQIYRHTPFTNQPATSKAFEDVKKFIISSTEE